MTDPRIMSERELQRTRGTIRSSWSTQSLFDHIDALTEERDRLREELMYACSFNPVEDR